MLKKGGAISVSDNMEDPRLNIATKAVLDKFPHLSFPLSMASGLMSNLNPEDIDNLINTLMTLCIEICESLGPQEIMKLDNTFSPLFSAIREKSSINKKLMLEWEEDYEYTCKKTQTLGCDENAKELPMYVENIDLRSKDDIIRIPATYKKFSFPPKYAHPRIIDGHTEHKYILELENPQCYYISGIEWEAEDSVDLFSYNFTLLYDELAVCVVDSDSIKVFQRILGIKENQIPFTMVKGGIPCPLNNTITVTAKSSYESPRLKITYLLKKLPTPIPVDPFIIYQYQSMQPITLDENKTLETRFSHGISHILFHSEPFYDGPVEAIFRFDAYKQSREEYVENPPHKRRVLSLPEHKSYRVENWRVFPLREMQASRLNQYPQGMIELYFSHLENKTSMTVNVISCNNPIIKNGLFTHPTI